MAFKAGEVANPNGRPPGTGSAQILGDLIRKTAKEILEAKVGKGAPRTTRLKQLMSRAANDDPMAFLDWVAKVIPKIKEVEIGGELEHHHNIELPNVPPVETYEQWLQNNKFQVIEHADAGEKEGNGAA
jgi:hypothetical protein